MSDQSYSFRCGSNYQSAWQSFSSKSVCNTSSYSHGLSTCQTVIHNYQCNQSYTNDCYHQTHQSSCGSGSSNVSVLTVALQDAARMGAGVQGDVGCSVDEHGQPQPPNLATLPAGDNADNDSITLTDVSGTTSVLGTGANDTITVHSGDSNILVVGDGAGDTLSIGDLSDTSLLGNNNILVAGNGPNDFLSVGAGNGNELFAGNGDGDVLIVNTGDSNALIVGNGAGDALFINTGNNNDLHTGDGVGDFLFVGTGDNNCLTIGNGDGAFASVGTGMSNDLEVGNGNNDGVSVGTGDNNLLHAGNGAQDFLSVGTGDHNTLCVGAGAGDTLSMGTGDYNLLHAGDGAGDFLDLGTGNFNALIAGNGAGDLIVAAGDNNVIALGDGASDIINLQSGNSNIILDGNGTNDMILVGGSVSAVGTDVNGGNSIVIGNGDGDQAWGSLGDGNAYMTGAGNDLVHTGGGKDFVYVDNHTEQSTAAMADPFHLTTQDSLAQNLFADGGNDTFAIQGTKQNCYQSYSSYHCGNTYSTAVSWQSELKMVGGDAPGLGTTVMTGGGGVEKYWFSDLWGNAVITDFNSANGDRVMIGGVSDPNISALGPVHMQYIHSAYDTANTGNVDLLITFGSSSNVSQSITLIDYKPQDTGGTSGLMQFNNVTFSNPQSAEAVLSHIFDFSLVDNQAVTNEIQALASQHLILH